MTESPPGAPDPRQGWAPRAALAAGAVFVAMALPFAVWQVVSQADEARYTVAAARMMASGDYIVPYAAWGEVRLLKPPLTYYHIVAGFALFGQSVFAVKSVWVLVSALVLWMTWALARGIGASRAGALVAVTALGSNILFFRGALTHNPDMPLVFGTVLALLGFVRLLSDDRPPAWAAWAAWLGVAWAFLSKGLLAVLLVVLALALRAAWGRLRLAGRNEAAAIGVALVASAWWWIAVALREPEALVSQFIGDQVGRQAAFDPLALLGVMAGLAVFLALSFLPVLLLALPWRRRALPPRSPGVVLLAVWAGLLVVLFSFGAYHPPRYLLPALPGVAALLGLALSELTEAELARRGGRAVRILLVATAGVALATAAVVYGGATLISALSALAVGGAVAGALSWLAGRGRAWIVLPLLVAWLPATVFLTWPAARLLAFPAAADFGVAAVRDGGLSTEEVVIFGKWRFLDRVGLRAPPIEGYRYSNDFREYMLEGARMVLSIDPRHAERLAALGWEVRVETGAAEGFGAGELWQAIRARDIAGLRERHGETLYIATRAGAP